MNYQEINSMENEILQEENISSQEKPSDKNGLKGKKLNILPIIKKFPSYVKKPKIITVIIFFISVIVLYAGLSLFSVKQESKQPIVTKIQAETPAPSASINPDFAQLQKRIDDYQKELEDLQNSKSLQAPEVDLDLKFD